jgi:hypothetical protein
MTLDQVEARFTAAARKQKMPERLDRQECSRKGTPTCVYLVRTARGGISPNLAVVAQANGARRLTKISLMFRNEDAGKHGVFEAMVIFGGVLVMLSPQLEAAERGELLQALVEGFTEKGEQARTIAGITYRLSSASGQQGLLFSAERGER